MEPLLLDEFDVLVDLQTGAVSLVLPSWSEGDEPIEIETVTPDDEFAPQE